ncbi:hypothetical protein [Pseudoalteromonas luteoviolacea]|uniref:Uncharacterized protein n=1 Tax=Pseudoalteromonas luteoviolacea DSM 6061 TaxID=1365250 RepID=A0A167BAC3_9GAMM|nr:hypothetical protein [Pseudoalteromonas luteoviolacea]KZN46311.1 hypothetical protein N475_25700 [Pseudoalteromonas luteoviolacea DSM 6061]MBE0388763.1 hypothetical protein [Pseudoalteromonas luteoviolacea DSM 6061]
MISIRDEYKIIGGSLATMGEQYHTRSMMLTDVGLSSANLLIKLTNSSTYFHGQDEQELKGIEEEISKEKISKGGYRSESLSKLKVEASEAYERTGKIWDSYVCNYHRNIEFARCNKSDGFKEFLSTVNSEIAQSKINDFEMKPPIIEFLLESVHIKKVDVTEFITKEVSYHGFCLNRNISNRKIKIWTKSIGSKYSVGLGLDSEVLRDCSKGSLEFFYLIGLTDMFGSSKFNPRNFYVTLPEDWFPIARFPFPNVYKNFETKEELIVGLGASLFMFHKYFELVESKL